MYICVCLISGRFSAFENDCFCLLFPIVKIAKWNEITIDAEFGCLDEVLAHLANVLDSNTDARHVCQTV